MRSSGTLFFLLWCGLFSVAVVRGQEEEAGEDAQEADAVLQLGEGNNSNDTAVAGVIFRDNLYVVSTTEGSLEETSAGGVDFTINVYDEELDPGVAAQYGGDGDDYVTAIAGDFSVGVDLVVVGGTRSEEEHLFGLETPTGEEDWFIATIDQATLETVLTYVNGTLENDQRATAVVIAEDGYVVAGFTWGEYFEENAGADNDEDSVGYDAWVLKIDFDLNPDFLWSIQFGTIAYDVPSALVLDDDGDVYVVGTTTDSSNIVSADDEDVIQSMFVYKLDGDDGVIIWTATDELGVLSDMSQAHGAVLSEDGDELYVSGNTQGVIPGYDGDSTDTDELFLLGLSEDDGTVNWVYQSENNAAAFGTGGVVLADDGSPIIAGIAFGNQFNLTFTYWEGGSGDMIAAKIDIEELEVVKYYNAAAASNLTREDALAMVKDPDVTDGVFLIGEENGDFEDEDVEPDDLSILILKVQLETIPEVEEVDDGEFDYPYFQTLGIFAGGGLVFYIAYKWAAYSKAASASKGVQV